MHCSPKRGLTWSINRNARLESALRRKADNGKPRKGADLVNKGLQFVGTLFVSVAFAASMIASLAFVKRYASVFFVSVAFAASMIASPSFAQEKDSESTGAYKIGVVDRKVVMEKFKKAKEEYKQLQEEVDELQKGIDALSEKIEKAKEKYEEEKDTLTPEERIEREDTIQSDYRESVSYTHLTLPTN